MNKTIFCIIALLIGWLSAFTQAIPTAPYLPAMSSQENDNAPITLQHPQEKSTVPAGTENVYLFGKLNLQEPSLDINGQAVDVYKNGTFIAYIPVQQGTFDILLTAQSRGQTYQAVRHIIVPGTPINKFTNKARFDESKIYPSRPLWLMPGDSVELSARGTPGAKVTASLSGLPNAKEIALTEDLLHPGNYRGRYTISETEKPRNVKIRYKMLDPQTKTEAKITAKQRLKILDAQNDLPFIRVKDANSKMRQLPVHQGSLYPDYRAFGEIRIDGRDNGLYRLRLAEKEYAWLEEKKGDLVSSAALRPNHIDDLQIVSEENNTQIIWQGSKQVPLSVHEYTDRLEVTFYYTESFIENFDFDTTSPLLERITWSMEQPDVIKFSVLLKPEQPLWGYTYRYDKNDFILQLNHRPTLTPQPGKPLAGARILIDAGHSPKRVPPYDGLVTPSGFLEYEVNLDLAEVLKAKLEAAGATVIMTREGDNHISLTGRYKKALQEQAHLFISLHHNALPDAANPWAAPRGYSVYYTYPHSFKLAESMHNSFSRHIDLPDSGLIANDVLFIPRISDMPSILIENAYMIFPEQEELVMSSAGREQFAQTIYEGILDFYGVKLPAKPAAGKKPSDKKK